MRSRAESGNIRDFTIISNTGNQSDITGGIAEFNYYESITSNSFTATATVIDTGYKGNNDSPQRDRGLVEKTWVVRCPLLLTQPSRLEPIETITF